MHPVAVINAGPLVALSLAGQLELLPILFHRILIPRAVYQEVAIDGLGRAGAAMLTDTMWRSRVVDAPEPDPLLIAELDRGEAEVIALANALQPCLAVIDEKRGRRIASQVYGLSVKGTAGIMVEAYRRGHIQDLRGILEGMKHDGYFLANAVIEAACRAADSA
jgi:predicted nucleic acid-binding protein